MNIITIDLGGTNTRVARFDDQRVAKIVGQPIRRRNTHDYENDLSFIVKTALELSGATKIDALGIGVPGRVNDEKTDMIASNNLPEWTNRRFCDRLAQSLHCSVYMDNDGVAAGLGEGYFGDTQSDFHYLIWGTGISGVLVEYKGEDKIIATYIRPDYKAFFDEWESECGGAALTRKYGKPGEELVQDDWAQINTLFAKYLHEYIKLAQPSKIVFGGGLAIHHAETITGHAKEMNIPIEITQFTADSGLVGALGLVRRGIVSAYN
ncbi:MAG TPA: ROK family protein [Candidatus Saccharimonadales bacterium]|nr:ROK family protein [Candidatus Saccharimonadales bacterium]